MGRTSDSRRGLQRRRRRRECDGCRERFTTYERVASANLQVVKSDGRREDFDREKLIRGLRLACVKRPISTDTIEELASAVEIQLYRMGKSEVAGPVIGELVMNHLRKLDDVAYVRFASVYRRFTDLEVLVSEIERLRDQKQRDEEQKRQMPLGF